jgi:hypothetical protein
MIICPICKAQIATVKAITRGEKSSFTGWTWNKPGAYDVTPNYGPLKATPEFDKRLPTAVLHEWDAGGWHHVHFTVEVSVRKLDADDRKAIIGGEFDEDGKRRTSVLSHRIGRWQL